MAGRFKMAAVQPGRTPRICREESKRVVKTIIRPGEERDPHCTVTRPQYPVQTTVTLLWLYDKKEWGKKGLVGHCPLVVDKEYNR